MTDFVLLHPPLLVPAVWAPCAAALTAAGDHVAVPDLTPTVDPPERWYDRATATVAAHAPRGAVVVAHSGAGVLVPLVADRLASPAAVFVDAVLPGSPTSDRFRGFLAQLPVEDGRLPRWTDWWPPQQVAEMIPDPALRAAIEAGQPRLPLAFYDQRVPVPPSWPPPRVGYLRLSRAYDQESAEARRQGWPTREHDGTHLDLATDPGRVAAEIRALA